MEGAIEVQEIMSAVGPHSSVLNKAALSARCQGSQLLDGLVIKAINGDVNAAKQKWQDWWIG